MSKPRDKSLEELQIHQKKTASVLTLHIDVNTSKCTEWNTFTLKYLRLFFSECGVTAWGLQDESVSGKTCVALRDAEINIQFQYLHNFSLAVADSEPTGKL